MINDIMAFMNSLNWQGIVAIFGCSWYFTRGIKSSLQLMEKRIDILEERMFQLATGKTLQQAILEERIKKGEK